MQPLTVFTPAYNRANTLVRLYDSLKAQTDKRFIWMVIDDGSTDDTEALIKNYKNSERDFEIEYIKKENGGLHTGYNCAIENCKTQLMVCIDSDDYMPNDAVEKILSFWEKNGSDEYAGIVGLDYYSDSDKIIGDKLPNQKSVNLIDLLVGRYDLRNGDRTNVVRTELYKEVAPMKTFEGEKNFNPHYMHLLISKKYDFLVLNENLRFVDYQPNGMSDSMLKQYLNSPNSFAEIRKLYLSFENTPLKFRVKNTIHLISSSILSKNLSKAFDYSNNKLLTLLLLPFGIMLSLYIKSKANS